MASTKEVKKELSNRADFISRPEFLEQRIRPFLNGSDGTDWETKLIQLDGTGACTVEVRLGGSQQVFAKLFPDDTGPPTYEKMVAIREAGFGEGERYQAVEPMAWIPEFKMLLTRPAPGRAIADYIGTDPKALTEGAREAGVWLAKLHTSDFRYGSNIPLLESAEPLPLARRLSKMIVKRPHRLKLVLDLIKKLEDAAEKTVDGLFVQTHGQYRPIHVFTSDDTVTVIDLDRGRPCDPSFDLAEFLHRMRTTSFWRTNSMEAADEPSRAFLEAYAEGVDPVNLTNLPFHWARYNFHSLTNKLKKEDGDNDTSVEFYRAEFENAVSGRMIPGTNGA